MRPTRAGNSGLGWVAGAAGADAKADAHLLKDHDQAGPYGREVVREHGLDVTVVKGPGVYQKFATLRLNTGVCDIRTLEESCNIAWDERGRAMLAALEKCNCSGETRAMLNALIEQTT